MRSEGGVVWYKVSLKFQQKVPRNFNTLER